MWGVGECVVWECVMCVCVYQGESPLLGLLRCQAYDHIFSFNTQNLPGREALASSLHRKLVQRGPPEAKWVCALLFPAGFCHLLAVLLG